MPYVIDLHVFLGRKMKIAAKETSPEEDGVLGRVPRVRMERGAVLEASLITAFYQAVIDDQNDAIHSLHTLNTDLAASGKNMNNAYQKYDSWVERWGSNPI